MTRTIRVSALALAISAGWTLPAQARATNDAVAQELAAMRAQMEAMAQRIDTLEAQLTEARTRADAAQSAVAAQAAALPQQIAAAVPPAPKPTTQISWDGAPKITGEGGWSFKPRGRLHIDAGAISSPGQYESANLGSRTRVRRARLGFEGTVPGGFGYKAEADFANAGVAFGDVQVSYASSKVPLTVRVGSFESLNSFEQISSSNFNTYIERAAFNDAFINARRLGVATALRSRNDDWRAEVGLFAGHAIDSGLDNDGWIGAARLVYAPKALGGQLHLGVNFQHRQFASNIGGGTSSGVGMPSTNQLARYRARPNSQLTDVRFVDTGSFAAKSDRILGVEAAAIFKGLYVSGEAQWLKADGYAAGATATGLDAFSGGNLAVVPEGNPGFFGAYAEVGYFLTGETRGYKRGDGTWARTKVLNPITKGGSGAFQLALRYDHLDLNDKALRNGPTNNFTTGASSLAAAGSRLGRGGRQQSYLFGLNWMPVDYVRIMLDYGRIDITGGPLAAQVKPLSTRPVNQRGYSLDLVQSRIQVDF